MGTHHHVSVHLHLIVTGLVTASDLTGSYVLASLCKHSVELT